MPIAELRLHRGYWCEYWTEQAVEQGNLAAGQGPALRESFAAHSAAQADSWLTLVLRSSPIPTGAAAVAAAWERLYEYRVDVRRALLRGEPCTMSTTVDGTHTTWTARPVLFLPLAHREGIELPACTQDVKSHTTD